jgi:hypothetical protein
MTVSLRTSAQVAEVNASTITSGSLSVVAGDTIVAWIFTDGGSASSCSDSSGATGFWDLFKDGSGSQKVYVKQRITTTTSLTVTYTNSQVAHLSMAVLVYSGVVQVLKKPADADYNDLDRAAAAAGKFTLGSKNTTGLTGDSSFTVNGHGGAVLVMACSYTGGSAAPTPNGLGQTSLFNQNGSVKWDLDTPASQSGFVVGWNTSVGFAGLSSGAIELSDRNFHHRDGRQCTCPWSS